MRLLFYVLAGSMMPIAAFAQTRDHAPTQLQSAANLRHDKGESWTYRKAGLQLSGYRSVLVDPTVVYAGPDAQFKDIPVADRAKFAAVLTDALRTELAGSVGVAARPGPGVLRLRMTLLGAEKTTGGVATATRVLPIGLATSAVKSLAGKPGSLTGSVLIALEITDSRTGELLAAAVRRESPDALDISATISTTDTVKAVGKDIAEKIRKRLQPAMQRR